MSGRAFGVRLAATWRWEASCRMSEVNEVAAAPLTWLEKLVPGQTHAETTSMVGRGGLVFLGGMGMALASFLVERAIVGRFKK
jgi:hypothetical protein